jgi:hypothetical protein
MNGDQTLDSLLDLNAPAQPPIGGDVTESGEKPMTMQEITDLQQQVLLAKQGKGERPSREQLKKAYDSLRFYRSGAGSSRKESAPKTKVAPVSDADLNLLFGSGEQT